MENDLKVLVKNIKNLETSREFLVNGWHEVLIDNRENALQELFDLIEYDLPAACKGTLKKINYISDFYIKDNEIYFLIWTNKKVSCDLIRIHIEALLSIILNLDIQPMFEFKGEYITDISNFNNKFKIREKDTFIVLNKCLTKYTFSELYETCKNNKFEKFYKYQLDLDIDNLLEKSPYKYDIFGHLISENFELIQKQILEKIEIHKIQLEKLKKDNMLKAVNLNKSLE